jgi:hypothetical protein
LAAKDKVKQLLDNAMKGFEESGRIQALSDSKHQTPLPESNEEKKSSNIQLDNLKGTIERYAKSSFFQIASSSALISRFVQLVLL